MTEQTHEQRVSPTVRLRKVLRALRRWRESAGMDQADVGQSLVWSKARVSRLERGETIPGPAEVLALAAVYGISEAERDEYVALAVQARQKGWWKKYGSAAASVSFEECIGLESEAATVRNFEIDLIPGLLQIAPYAEALGRAWVPAADEGSAKRMAELREARQARLYGANPLRLDVVVGETAVRQRIGGSDTMRDQLHHMLSMMELSNVDVRVLPYAAGAYPAMGAPFLVLSFPEQEENDVVCVDTVNSSVYVEDLIDVEQYNESFRGLQSAALSSADTADLLRRMLDELEDSKGSS